MKNMLLILLLSLGFIVGCGEDNSGGNTKTSESTNSGVVNSGDTILLNTQIKSYTVKGDFTFYDDGGSSANYSLNINHTVTFKPEDVTKKLRITFNSFSLEDKSINSSGSTDYLKIYNGSVVDANLLTINNGTSSPGTITSTASDGALTFVFSSDSTTISSGWEAKITEISSKQFTTNVLIYSGTRIVDEYGIRLFDSGGAYFGNGDNEDITLVLKPRNSTDKVSIGFNSFSLENQNDFLKIYNGSLVKDSNIVGNYTGTNSPGLVTSTSNDGALTLRFTSDYSSAEIGWDSYVFDSGNYSLNMTNGSFVVGANGMYLYDSGGPDGNYSASETYTATFYPLDGTKKLTLTINEMDTEVNFDQISVFDGNTINASEVATISGNSTTTTVTSTASDGSLTLKFTSDNQAQYSGWKISLGY